MTVGITELPPEGMQLGGVALAGDAERGTKTTEGLSLLFTTAGITVQGPQPQIERLLVWSGLDSASCREKIALPDGRNAAVMELTSGGQSIRFLLPMDAVTPGQAAYLDQALPAWLARYKGSVVPSAPPPRSPSAPPPAPAHASTLSNGGSTSSGSQRSGEGSRTDVIAPAGIEAPGGRGPRPDAGRGRCGRSRGRCRSCGRSECQRHHRGPVRPGFGLGAAGVRIPGPSRPPIRGRRRRARICRGPRSSPGRTPGPCLRREARRHRHRLPPALRLPRRGTGRGRSRRHRRVGPVQRGGERGRGIGEPAGGGEPSPEDRRSGQKAQGLAQEPRLRPVPKCPPSATPEAPRLRFLRAVAARRQSRPPTPSPSHWPARCRRPPPGDLAAPGTRGPIAWRPPIDPLTGEPAWDQSPAPAATPPKKRRSWHRGAKDSAVAAAGAASAAAIAGSAGSAGAAGAAGAAAAAAREAGRHRGRAPCRRRPNRPRRATGRCWPSCSSSSWS